MVAVFMGYSSWAMTFTMAGLALIAIVVLLYVTHSSILSLLKSLSSLWFMAIFLLLIYIVMPSSSTWVAFYIGSYAIYWDSILNAVKILVRLILMIALTMIFTSTTKPLDMTDAFEWYLLPLKWIGFPAHELAMILSIALRFIPTILEDVNRIMKAQASRGVDFAHGKLSTKFRAIISLIIPLFVSSFSRSEELANAMECRGYDPKLPRTRYRIPHFAIRDLIAFLVVGAFCALFIYVSVSNFNAYSTWWGLVVK
jgi:energy-coupling factor transport system permease protein